MKRSILILAVVLLGAQQRSVRVVPPHEPARAFDASQSAALFVGVRKFEDGTLAEVRYAVDDAIDLAYAFTQQNDLVPPSRVVLALSGAPVKQKSRQKLTWLLGTGVTLVNATRADVSSVFEQQAARAGANGLFVVSFATHGFSKEGTPYVLASDSRFGDPGTSLSTSRLLDVASRAGRSLVFLDACRERVKIGRGVPNSRGSPALRAMRSIHGQVVFYAAAAGQYAYDKRGNGVFTGAVLEGLACKAVPDDDGFVTVDSLARYVEKDVRQWINRNREPKVKVATQVSMDGGSGSMPLVSCGRPDATPAFHLQSVEFSGSMLKTASWSRTLDGPITEATVADLDDDGSNEAIAAAGETIFVFNAAGKSFWTRKTEAPIRTFVVDDLLAGQTRQVVALSRSHLSIIDSNGAIRDCSPAGMLHQVVTDRPTSHHARKIIVAGIHEDLSPTLNVRGPVVVLALIDPKTCTTQWRGAVLPPRQFIEKLETRDVDNDSRRDITLITSAGRLTVGFDGTVIRADGIQFTPIR